MKRLIIAIVVVMSMSVYSKNIYIASFNTLHLGWSDKKDYENMANFLDVFNIVALQEVMNEQGLVRLVEELNNISSSQWEYHISKDPVGSSGYNEYYSFIWKSKDVSLESVEGYYPYSGFKRSPYGVTFKAGEIDFTYVNCHIVFGDSKDERKLETLQLDRVYDYFQGLDSEEQDILIGGDFNLPAYDDGFKTLLSHRDKIYYGVNPKYKTTIGKNRLANSYDNIFYSYKYTGEYTGNSGIIDFTEGDYKVVRKMISDHLPVFLELDTSRDDD